MSIWNNLFGSLKSTFSQWWNIGGPAVYSNIKTNDAVTKGFLGNSAVYAIVMKDVNKFASIPRYVYDVKDIEEKEFKGAKKELEKLINRPNPEQSQDAFYAHLRAYYKVTGEYFVWLNRGDLTDADGNPLSDEVIEKMPVLEMYVLPSNLMSIIPDPDDLFAVKGYILETSQRIKFSPASIIHGKNVNIDFDETTRPHLRGLPPLSPGYKSLQQNNDATDSSVRMLQNGGSKGALTNETLNNLTPDQKSSIENILDAKINNKTVKGSVATLPGKWNYLNFGMSSVDMQLLDAKNMSMMELCFLFDVPFTFFDPNTAFANSEWQKKNWINDSIIPAVKMCDGEFNRQILKAFDLEGKAFIGSDFSELPELQADMEKQARAFQLMWWISPNEKAKVQGFDPNPNPIFDEPFIPGGYTPLSELNDDERILRELDDE